MDRTTNDATDPGTGGPQVIPPGRVMVVDDDTAVADVVKEVLEMDGFDVSVAHTYEEAIRRIPEIRPDLILTDLQLGGASGLDVMRFARQEDPYVSIILMTGYASGSTATDALNGGAETYITKPFETDKLSLAVAIGVNNRHQRIKDLQGVQELHGKHDILQRHESELRERVQLATGQLTKLYDVGKEINANLELEPRLQTLAIKTAELSGAAVAVVYLQSADSGEYRAVTAHGANVVPREDGGPHLLVGEGPIGLALFEMAPIRRTADDASIAAPGIDGGPHHQLLAVPMVAEAQVIGALVMLEKAGGFTDEDERFLSLFAAQAAVQVLNSQLFEHTKSLDRLKSEFVAVVSHEIRTPLTSVKGAVELLSDDRFFQNNDQQQKLLAIAHANAERLLVLINDILDFSKLEADALPMTIEPQRIEPVVQQAVHNLRTLIEERRMEVTVELAESLPDLLIDSGRIAQVLTNLLSNAIKFSPAGSRIEVSVARSGNGARIAVRDQGEGIAEQDLPKLFQRFSQIDTGATRKVGGTGLGLVISKGIVERHGGRISVESRPGEGSMFYFELPGVAVESQRHNAAA